MRIRIDKLPSTCTRVVVCDGNIHLRSQTDGIEERIIHIESHTCFAVCVIKSTSVSAIWCVERFAAVKSPSSNRCCVWIELIDKERIQELTIMSTPKSILYTSNRLKSRPAYFAPAGVKRFTMLDSDSGQGQKRKPSCLRLLTYEYRAIFGRAELCPPGLRAKVFSRNNLAWCY